MQIIGRIETSWDNERSGLPRKNVQAATSIRNYHFHGVITLFTYCEDNETT
jgi:hypothetical protein